MSTEKNILKWNHMNITGDMHVGDIYNFIKENEAEAFVVVIIVMTQSDIQILCEEKMDSFRHLFKKKLYILDNYDFEENLKFFYESCFKDVVPSEHYHSTSKGWKPFLKNNDKATNQSIEELLIKIFNKRKTVVRCLYIESDLPIKNLLQSQADIETFIDILGKAVIVFDPISLSHKVHKEFIEELHDIPIGGVISPICHFSPNDVIHFSRLQLKRITHKWHLDAKMPNSNIHFSIADQFSFEKSILSICENLGYKINLDILNKGSKEILNNTRQLG